MPPPPGLFVCFLICVCVHAHTHIHEWRQEFDKGAYGGMRASLGVSLPSCLMWSLLFSTMYARLAGLPASKGFPASISQLLIATPGLQMCASALDFYRCSEDSNFCGKNFTHWAISPVLKDFCNLGPNKVSRTLSVWFTAPTSKPLCKLYHNLPL